MLLRLFQPDTSIHVMSNKVGGKFTYFKIMNVSMAAVVVPHAGLKPLTQWIDLKPSVVYNPPPSPGIVQGSHFMREAFECIPYGVRSCIKHPLSV